MQKPISIAYRQMKEELVNVVNGSGLPIDMIASAIKDLKEAVDLKAEELYIEDVETYSRKLQRKNEKKKEEANVDKEIHDGTPDVDG